MVRSTATVIELFSSYVPVRSCAIVRRIATMRKLGARWLTLALLGDRILALAFENSFTTLYFKR